MTRSDVDASSKDDRWGEMTSEAIQAACHASAPRNALLRHPIFRQIYIVYFLVETVLIYIPLWSIYYAPRSNRPREKWSIQRCLRVAASRRFCATMAQCEVDYLGRDLNKDLDPLTLKESHPVTIPPAPASYLRGHPAETLNLLHASRGLWYPHFLHRSRRDKPGVWGRWNLEHEREKVYGFEPVKAFWYTGKKDKPADGEFGVLLTGLILGPLPRRPGEVVAMHFHGGGYLVGTAAESDLTSSIPKTLVSSSPIHHVLSVDYRLAPTSPWPLPLLDAISAYRYLLDEGIGEKEIVIVGDSAGGHLGLALIRWLRDEGPALGLSGPRGLVVLSPWVDVGFTNAWGDDNMKHNAESDMIDDSFGPFATSLLLRALPIGLMHTSPYLSPASLLIPPSSTGPNSLEGFPPTFVVYGGAERLARSIGFFWSRLQLARKAESSAEGAVVEDRLVEGPDAVHDFMVFPWQAEEAAAVYEQLNGWLGELLEVDKKLAQDKLDRAEPSGTAADLDRSTLRSPPKDDQPLKDDQGVLKLIEDIGDEGITLIDSPHLEPNGGSTRPWLSPLRAASDGMDWCERELTESESGSDSESSEENRKDR